MRGESEDKPEVWGARKHDTARANMYLSLGYLEKIEDYNKEPVS